MRDESFSPHDWTHWSIILPETAQRRVFFVLHLSTLTPNSNRSAGSPYYPVRVLVFEFWVFSYHLTLYESTRPLERGNYCRLLSFCGLNWINIFLFLQVLKLAKKEEFERNQKKKKSKKTVAESKKKLFELLNNWNWAEASVTETKRNLSENKKNRGLKIKLTPIKNSIRRFKLERFKMKEYFFSLLKTTNVFVGFCSFGWIALYLWSLS